MRRVDAELKLIVRQMFDLMYEHNGVGLAANQVDLPYRLFVMNLDPDQREQGEELVFINPVIIRQSGTVENEEGCLSVPEIYAPVRRPEKVTIAGYNLSGEEVQFDLSGLAARAVQHETDHLDGVLFIDRLSPANLLAVKSELEELELEFEGDRRRGLIPDDGRIASRLEELEALRT